MTDEAPRSAALRVARARRMAEWFEKRRWRVCAEMTYETEDIKVIAGEFGIKNGKVFKTPFGNKGTHGYILQEVDPATGQDVWVVKKDAEGKATQERSRASFGWVTIKSASELYPGSIAEVPPRPYGQRGGVAAQISRRDPGNK